MTYGAVASGITGSDGAGCCDAHDEWCPSPHIRACCPSCPDADRPYAQVNPHVFGTDLLEEYRERLRAAWAAPPDPWWRRVLDTLGRTIRRAGRAGSS